MQTTGPVVADAAVNRRRITPASSPRSRGSASRTRSSGPGWPAGHARTVRKGRPAAVLLPVACTAEESNQPNVSRGDPNNHCDCKRCSRRTGQECPDTRCSPAITPGSSGKLLRLRPLVAERRVERMALDAIDVAADDHRADADAPRPPLRPGHQPSADAGPPGRGRNNQADPDAGGFRFAIPSHGASMSGGAGCPPLIRIARCQ